MSKLEKTAVTTYPVIDLIRRRWSPRSFSSKSLSQEDCNMLIEAASWSFSSGNVQPWRFIFARKEDTERFERILGCLDDFNQIWAKKAAALMVGLAQTHYEKEGNPQFNAWAEHDLGASHAHLLLQATSMGISSHPMGGFNADKVKTAFNLPLNLKPIFVTALGYLGDVEDLDEFNQKREVLPRTRKPIAELLVG